jgi:hypothetical protein
LKIASGCLWLARTQRKQRPHISDILQAFEQWDQMQQSVIRGIVEPTLYRYRIICFKS